MPTDAATSAVRTGLRRGGPEATCELYAEERASGGHSGRRVRLGTRLEQLPDRVAELEARERLLQQRPRILAELRDDGVAAVPGDEEHAQVDAALRADPGGELLAVHAGHDEVGDERVERALGPPDLERLLGVRGGADPVAVELDHLRDERADDLLVLDEQDGALAGPEVDRRLGLDAGDDGRGARQEDVERGAFARLAGDADVAAALRHDPVDGREPEARALAGLLRREERLEDVLARLLVDAGPRVGDAERDVRPGLGAQELRVGARELGVPGRDRKHAALGHRVASVDRE